MSDVNGGLSPDGFIPSADGDGADEGHGDFGDDPEYTEEVD